MDTMMVSYAKTLAKIENEPDYNRKRAEERFFLIKEFLSGFGRVTPRKKAIAFYCNQKRIKSTSFTRWLQNYKDRGIKGLLPSYGNRKGSSPYMKVILPIVAEIIKPDQPIADLHRQLLPICERLGIQPPSARTVGRMVKTSGLSILAEKQKVITTISAALEVDTQNPLNCLLQLSEFIRTSPVFSIATKEHSVSQLRKFLNAVSRRSPLELARPLTATEMKTLKRYKASQHKRHSIIATALLMINENSLLADVVNATGSHPGTILGWIKRFKNTGVSFIEVKLHHPERTKRLDQRKDRILDIIHTPPSTFNINRTTWTYGRISDVYALLYHEHISTKTIERVVNQTGYTWRRTRRVQTSPDPDYHIKVERLLDTLKSLRENDRFFFIDEAGPYRVRKYGGRVLVPRDQIPTEQEYQKSRGKIQFVAALEAVKNQLIWRFTTDKTATSIIALLEMIVKSHAACMTAFLTWDAVSMHNSKAVTEWIAMHNAMNTGVHIEIVPLPSNAQFLNVIESVFCGMKKAVICNSDYAAPYDMQMAITRHFEERNEFYKANPKRAGNKIWDKQKFDFERLAGGLFRRM